MHKEILVQSQPESTVVAVLENGRLAEIYLERTAGRRLVGNVYQGRVANILPGMQAAFIDLGVGRNGFLYLKESKSGGGHLAKLTEGQTLMVQVVKEPLGSKGPRVTTGLTLPGRHLVLVPGSDYVGISKRIQDASRREELRRLVQSLRPPGVGFIVRTAAEGGSEADLEAEVDGLIRLWSQIKKKSQTARAPELLHRDLELVARVLRDFYTEEVDRVRFNSRDTLQQAIEAADLFGVNLAEKAILAPGQNLLKLFNIPAQAREALRRKVWLKCGGYLVFDETEALAVIDVNTGRFVGTKSLQETIFRTNMEAAVEIVRQIRLRNLGGIIIVDFIDMERPEHQEKVLALLTEMIKKDRIKTHLLGLTSLGLVEITRKKTYPSLASMLQTVCPHCEGSGRIWQDDLSPILFGDPFIPPV